MPHGPDDIDSSTEGNPNRFHIGKESGSPAPEQADYTSFFVPELKDALADFEAIACQSSFTIAAFVSKKSVGQLRSSIAWLEEQTQTELFRYEGSHAIGTMVAAELLSHILRRRGISDPHWPPLDNLESVIGKNLVEFTRVDGNQYSLTSRPYRFSGVKQLAKEAIERKINRTEVLMPFFLDQPWASDEEFAQFLQEFAGGEARGVEGPFLTSFQASRLYVFTLQSAGVWEACVKQLSREQVDLAMKKLSEEAEFLGAAIPPLHPYTAGLIRYIAPTEDWERLPLVEREIPELKAIVIEAVEFYFSVLDATDSTITEKVRAHINLCWFYNVYEKWTHMLDHANAAVKLSYGQDGDLMEHHLDALFDRARAQVGLGKLDVARQDFETVIKGKPPSARTCLGACIWAAMLAYNREEPFAEIEKYLLPVRESRFLSYCSDIERAWYVQLESYIDDAKVDKDKANGQGKLVRSTEFTITQAPTIAATTLAKEFLSVALRVCQHPDSYRLITEVANRSPPGFNQLLITFQSVATAKRRKELLAIESPISIDSLNVWFNRHAGDFKEESVDSKIAIAHELNSIRDELSGEFRFYRKRVKREESVTLSAGRLENQSVFFLSEVGGRRATRSQTPQLPSMLIRQIS